jgi:carbon-monoxide dehydrogenase large subunit/6-hydroxypseudooxynicotine dehydrogenase subunit gamma
MAQICAEALGVDYRRVRVIHGQTDRAAFGIGAHASRATVLTGNAVNVTALKLRDKALAYASELLQTATGELDIVDGIVVTRGTSIGPSISLADIAVKVAPGATLLGDREPGLTAEGWYNTDRLAFSYGVHVALARIDRETGGVALERYVVAQEVGRAVNPMLIEGQLTGGCLQGIGGSLYEEFTYSDSGDPLSVTLADYLCPLRAKRRVEIVIAEAPEPFNPSGSRAPAGGINGAGAAIAGAVDDALGQHGAMTGCRSHLDLAAYMKDANHEIASPSIEAQTLADARGRRARAAAICFRNWQAHRTA